MPIDGLPNPRVHRHCRICREWFDPWEGSFQWPERNSMIAWLRVKVAQQIEDDSVKTWVCLRCHPLDGDPSIEATTEKAKASRGMTGLITAIVVLALGVLAMVFKEELYLILFG